MTSRKRTAAISLAEELWKRGDGAWDRGNLDQAERFLRESAEMGDVNAMNSLATLLDDRLNRKQEAVDWYRRAVAAGHAMAAWNLAMHYVALRQNRLYRFWMRKAALMGDEDAAVEVHKFDADPAYITDPLAWYDD